MTTRDLVNKEHSPASPSTLLPDVASLFHDGRRGLAAYIVSQKLLLKIKLYEKHEILSLLVKGDWQSTNHRREQIANFVPLNFQKVQAFQNLCQVNDK